MLTLLKEESLSKEQEATATTPSRSPSPLGLIRSASGSTSYAYLGSVLRNPIAILGIPTTPYSKITHCKKDIHTGWLASFREDLVKTVTDIGKLSEETEKGMCSFWIDTNLVLLITNPEAVANFKNNYYSQHFQHNNPAWEVFPGTAMLHGETTNKTVRGFYNHQFGGDKFKSLKKNIADVSDKYLSKFASSNESVIANASEYFRGFALELATRFLMGVNNFENIDTQAYLEFIAELIGGYAPDSGLYLLGLLEPDSTAAKLAEKFKEKMVQKLAAILLPVKEEILTSNPASILKSLWELSATTNNDLKHTTLHVFADAVFFLIGGPVVSVADSFTIILQLLADNPHIEARLVEKIEESKKTGKENFDTDTLNYVDMIIYEAFRLYPPFPIIPVRKPKADFIFKEKDYEVQIKMADRVLISPLVIHHSDKYWPEPKKFMPERFERQPSPGTFLPFGLGPNKCVGQYYAMAVLKTMITKFYCDFTLKIISEKDPQLSGPSMVSQRMNITLTKRNGDVADNTLEATEDKLSTLKI